jgi:hypothetical protein
MAEADRFQLNSGEIVAEVIAGEGVIINLSSGIYYSLDGAGGFAWAMLVTGHSRGEVAEAIAGHYGIDAGRAETELDALLTELTSENLIQPAAVENGAAPAEVADDALPPPGAGYAPPRLQRFEDMGELLAVDPPMPQTAQSPWQPPQA